MKPISKERNIFVKGMICMRSKKIAAICLAAGLTVLGTAGIIAYASGNPYENYRTAVINTATAKDMTVGASFSIMQDGAVIADGTAVYQKNAGAQYSVVNAEVSGQNVFKEEYSDGNVRIKSDGISYSQKTRKNKENENDNLTPSTIKLAQMTADMLVGDLTTQFTSDGSNVSVQLTDTQIPEIANTAASAFAEMTAAKDKQSENDIFDNTVQQLAITQNVKIESVTMNADITDGMLSSQKLNIVLSGETAGGERSTVEVSVNADITNIGSTVPQSIDTSSMQETAFADNED